MIKAHLNSIGAATLEGSPEFIIASTHEAAHFDRTLRE
jgi:hypothetical protein